MTRTRGMTAKQNQNAGNRKRSKTTDNNGDSPSWENLIHDILFSIIVRLGVVDFIAFSCVCKSWRTAALSNRKIFMLSRQPMIMHISTEVDARKECWLEDFEGRRFKTILPRSGGRICVGLVSGYLILFGKKTHDFKLVNLITRLELHFPRFPFRVVAHPKSIKCTLIFSPTSSRWVFVISPRFSLTVSFSLSGKQASWTHLSSDFPISDLIFFKGKIYTLNTDASLCEVRLDPNPTVTLLKMQNLVTSRIILPEFATWGEKLFLKSYGPRDPYPVEVDFDKMKLVTNELEDWDEPHMPYLRLDYFIRTAENKKKRVINMWYCPHKCLDANVLHE